MVGAQGIEEHRELRSTGNCTHDPILTVEETPRAWYKARRVPYELIVKISMGIKDY